jgi:LysR family glycine cleavage system transcriptional activator
LDFIRNLNSIQIFERVHVCGNLTRAAEALNTTQSSISYHIKKLEDELGVALFRRTGNGLQPTDEGAALAAEVERGLATIRAGLQSVSARTSSLKVAMLPMFASRWLSSRLGGFWEEHPHLQLSIQNHNNNFVRMARPAEFADLGIQWGLGQWPRFEVNRLWSERLVVVCSPDYQRSMAIKTPSDIRRCTLLHVDDDRMWSEWMETVGLAPNPTQPQMMLEDRHFQLSSTINGLGVSLFAAWLITDELREGKLVNPLGTAFGTAFAYHLVSPAGTRLSQPAARFKNWILGAGHSFI